MCGWAIRNWFFFFSFFFSFSSLVFSFFYFILFSDNIAQRRGQITLHCNVPVPELSRNCYSQIIAKTT